MPLGHAKQTVGPVLWMSDVTSFLSAEWCSR